jgi:hypothetical protein
MRNALANGIGTVIRQPQDFQPDIAHGRAEFGWEAVIDERLSLYRRLLDERAPSSARTPVLTHPRFPCAE